MSKCHLKFLLGECHIHLVCLALSLCSLFSLSVGPDTHNNTGLLLNQEFGMYIQALILTSFNGFLTSVYLLIF